MNYLTRPQRLSPAYNPIYVYGDSPLVANQSFTYRTFVSDTNDVIFTSNIMPRYGDDLLSFDASKVLQSRLGHLGDDIVLGSTGVFHNTPHSGYRYNILSQERYRFVWPFTGATVSTFLNDQIMMTSDESSPFSTGDIVTVSGLSRRFPFTSIAQDGSLSRLTLSSPHNLSDGDFVFIQQDSPFCHVSYNGLTEVIDASDPDTLLINKTYAGPCLFPNTGEVIFEQQLDGTAVVVVAGGSAPNFELVINKTASISGSYSGTVVYTDQRLFNGDIAATRNSAIFNGALLHNEWPDYDYNDYSPIEDEFNFLTNIPDVWMVRPENDLYLNYWTGDLTQIYSYLLVDNGTDVYQVVNDAGTPSTIQAVNVGPSVLTGCVDIEVIPAEMGIFATSGDWTITTDGNATASINDSLFFEFTGIGGSGEADVIIPDVLEIGTEYTVIIDVSSNVQTEIDFAHGTPTVVGADQTGIFSHTFTANNTTASIVFTGVSGTFSATVTSIKFRTNKCDIIDCDTSTYSISLQHRLRDDELVVLTPGYFWTMVTADNAFGEFIEGGVQYSDLVEFGGTGLLSITQEDALMLNGNYDWSINVSNNSGCSVFIGPLGDVVMAADVDQTGTFDGAFVATDTSFVIAIVGASASGTNGCTVIDIVVRRTDQIVTNSEVRTFELDCSCTGRYDNTEMLFKDRMGSMIPFNWTINHTEKVMIDRKGYKRHIGDLDMNSNNGHNYKIQDSSYNHYDMNGVEEWELNSDWISESASLFMEYIKTSPDIYIRVNDVYTPVRVKDLTYDRIFKRNKKMIIHKCNIIMNNENNINI